MARYRKKPVVIDAWQFDGTWETAKDIVFGHHQMGWSEGSEGNRIIIDRMVGSVIALPGQWVIREGENFSVMDPDIFAAAYEPEE